MFHVSKLLSAILFLLTADVYSAVVAGCGNAGFPTGRRRFQAACKASFEPPSIHELSRLPTKAIHEAQEHYVDPGKCNSQAINDQQYADVHRPAATGPCESPPVALQKIGRASIMPRDRIPQTIPEYAGFFLKRTVGVVSTIIYIRYNEVRPELKAYIEPATAPLRSMFERIKERAATKWSSSAENEFLEIFIGHFRWSFSAFSIRKLHATVPWLFVQHWSDGAIAILMANIAFVTEGWYYWPAVGGLWIYVALTWNPDIKAPVTEKPPSLHGYRRFGP